jgi:hypothetical protein
MKKSDAVRYFKTEYALAKALGINQSAVSRWGNLVPLKRAIQVEQLSGGAVKYDQGRYVK